MSTISHRCGFLMSPISYTLRIRFARDAIYTYTVYAVIVMYTRIASLSHDIPRSPTLSPSLSLTHHTRTHTHTHVHAHTHTLSLTRCSSVSHSLSLPLSLSLSLSLSTFSISPFVSLSCYIRRVRSFHAHTHAYTQGPILIVLNPWKDIAGLYDSAAMLVCVLCVTCCDMNHLLT